MPVSVAEKAEPVRGERQVGVYSMAFKLAQQRAGHDVRDEFRQIVFNPIGYLVCISLRDHLEVQDQSHI